MLRAAARVGLRWIKRGFSLSVHAVLPMACAITLRESF
ncbi:hypothetical protein M2282_004378 [Variovorax boronicumulans]|nr:hypothetical protein [Variovorax boronicumulans]